MNILVKKCKYCNHDILGIEGIDDHWWGCRENDTKVLLEKIARRLDDIATHLNC